MFGTVQKLAGADVDRLSIFSIDFSGGNETMSLLNMTDILKVAARNGYAVGAFNVVNLDFLEAIIKTAETCKSPVILNIAEVHFRYVDLDQIVPVILRVAEKSQIPVALNLDHGVSFEGIMKAIRCGFTSVMFDGSRLPLDENIEKTRQIVKMSHALNISVEAELGHVGGGEGSREGTAVSKEAFTRPDEAIRFVNETGVDALAIAFGSVHGRYKGDPELDFELLDTCRKQLGIPLVLHGGSGISDNDFKRAISLGIAKINIFTEMTIAATDRIKETIQRDPGIISLADLLVESKVAIAQVVENKMRTFGSAGVCSTTNALCGPCQACGFSGGAAPPALPPSAVPAPAPQEEQLVDAITRVVMDTLKQR